MLGFNKSLGRSFSKNLSLFLIVYVIYMATGEEYAPDILVIDVSPGLTGICVFILGFICLISERVGYFHKHIRKMFLIFAIVFLWSSMFSLMVVVFGFFALLYGLLSGDIQFSFGNLYYQFGILIHLTFFILSVLLFLLAYRRFDWTKSDPQDQ